MTGPLDGIRVLDFGRYVAGPVCAALLGDLGAEVVRVERIDGAEDRTIVPLATTAEGAADGGSLFLQANRNKLGMTLNPFKPDGARVLRRLLGTADVVVANLPDQALAAMGLDEASVHAVRRDIVLVTVDAFGPGPWAGRLGFDGIGQVMSGMAHLTGEPDVPGRAGVLWVDYMTAALAALGAMAGLRSRTRERTSLGEHVRVNLLHTAIHAMSSAMTEESVTAPARVASGNQAQTIGPGDIVATEDGWVVVQVVGNPMFSRFATMIGRPDLIADPRFGDDLSRGAHRKILCDLAAGFCRGRTTEDVLVAFDSAGLATAPVLTPAEVLTHPHIAAAGMLAAVDYPGAPTPPVVATPPLAFASFASRTGRAPLLGEHTDAILGELGYSAEEVAELRRTRIV